MQDATPGNEFNVSEYDDEQNMSGFENLTPDEIEQRGKVQLPGSTACL